MSDSQRRIRIKANKRLELPAPDEQLRAPTPPQDILQRLKKMKQTAAAYVITEHVEPEQSTLPRSLQQANTADNLQEQADIRMVNEFVQTSGE